MRARSLFFIFPPLLAALVLGIFLAPSGKEVALMQMSSSDSGQSLETYEALHSKGDHSISVLAPLINLHLHYGDADQAISLLENFTKEHPRNVEGRKRLAELYKIAQRYHDYCVMLEEIEGLSPSPAGLRELANTYAFLGAYRNEMNTLVRLARFGGERLTEEDAVKLARYYRIEDNAGASIETLERLVEQKAGKVAADTVYLFVQLLLENGDDRKAWLAAAGYVEDYQSEDTVLKVAELFQMNHKIDLAHRVMEPFSYAAGASPPVKQQIVGLLFAEGKTDIVYELLAEDFANETLPSELAETLIDLAQTRKDYGLIDAVLRKADFNDLSTTALVRFADLSLREKRKSTAEIIEARLDEGRRGENEPLLSAMLGLALSDTPSSFAALLAVPEDALATSEEKLMTAHVLFEHGKHKQAQKLIENIAVHDILGVFDPFELASLYLDNPSLAKEGEQRLAVAGAAMPPDARAKADRAVFFIKIGLGDDKSVDLWLKKHPKLSPNFFDDAFDLASRFRHNKIALLIAEYNYKAQPSPQKRSRLVDALLADMHYAEALTHMQADVDNDPGANIAAYISVLSEWTHKIKNADKNFSPMQPFVQFALNRLHQNEKAQRDMVYLLEEAGFKTEAESLLVNLATGRSFASAEVQELLGFWGSTPSPAAFTWIKNRAIAATDLERAPWLAHLQEIDHPEAVVEIVKNLPAASPAIKDIYIAALIAMRSLDLSNVLAQELERETEGERLKRLVSLAEQQGMQELKDKGWQKLYAVDPDDQDALKYVALQEAAANHYAAALPLLRRAIRNNPDDYQLNLAYGGIMQHKKKKFEAKVFYDRAFDQLSDIPDKSLYDRLTMAHLLYRKKGLAESAELFRELIREYPDDKSLRADFAEILMENKRYDEASAVLTP